MLVFICKGGGCMGETSSSVPGLPGEAATEILPEENLETVEAHTNQADLERRMYDLIIKNRVMARGLIMAGANTRDGLYTAWSYNALASAGLFLELLRGQGTENSQQLELGRVMLGPDKFISYVAALHCSQQHLHSCKTALLIVTVA
jgi:hypothetical protein